jgi:hypothetical protein
VPEPEILVAPARRSHRVHIAMPLLVPGPGFQEMTSTVAVNAHGCLVMLQAKVSRGDHVWLINPKTVEELPAKIAFLGKPEEGKTPVGIEFLEASPLFWRISFPPEDWTTSSERKRPVRSDFNSFVEQKPSPILCGRPASSAWIISALGSAPC